MTSRFIAQEHNFDTAKIKKKIRIKSFNIVLKAADKEI